jgi:hypothetical protein
MAELIVPLLATQVARARFPVPDRLMFRVEKVALFYLPVSGGTFSSAAIEIIKWGKFFAVAQAKVSHLEAWVCIGRGIPHVKGHNCVLWLVIPKNKCVKKKSSVCERYMR